MVTSSPFRVKSAMKTQDNIDCESEIIFDNDEDKTDSTALLPCIEQAREDIRTLRQLQFLQQNR
ncbi:DUF957 domain-containing protein [Escherichia coli]|uniref:DUF957 domain-containing protein n=1 Tax=Escherichia coli TaxID=562 RepID=UPI000DD3F55D|nr:DUF957 domain-containing protein [Escherichia coli]